jgi:hypothetical protein
MPQFRKICISAVAAIAMIVTSMPAHSITTSTLGTFTSEAACRAKGRRLVRAGTISKYRCLRSGKVWKLRSASDSDRNPGSYRVPGDRRIQSKKYRTTRTTRSRYGGRYGSMAACRARGRALVRAGKIASFRCNPTL